MAKKKQALFVNNDKHKKRSRNKRHRLAYALFVIAVVVVVIVAVSYIMQYGRNKSRSRSNVPVSSEAPITDAEPAKLYAQQSVQQLALTADTQSSSTTAPSSHLDFVFLPPPPQATSFILHLGKFNSNQKAHAIIQQLKKLGYRAKVYPVMTDGKSYYQIQIGKYQAVAIARQQQAKLQQAGYYSVVVAK